MKLKQVEAIIKARKVFTTFTTESAQWVGDLGAMYPIYDLPHLTEDNLLTMWDVPEDKRDKWQYVTNGYAPEMFRDDVLGDHLLERGMTPLCINGAIAEPIKTEQGVIFINQRYLRPFENLENGYELYFRQLPGKSPIIAVKEGYSLIGIIAPMDVIKPGFVEDLDQLVRLMRLSLENNVLAAARAAEKEEEENNS